MIPLVFWPHSERLQDRFGYLEELFPPFEYSWIHDFKNFPSTVNSRQYGAVIIVNGAANGIDMRQLNSQLYASGMNWALILSFCDEGSGQHLEWIDHSNVSLWVEMPKPGKHDAWHRLPVGALPRILNTFSDERPIDWFFSGQIKDRAWDIATRQLTNGKYVPYHMSHGDYWASLASSKVTICRPTWASPETCRVYDALEAGSVPIVGCYPSEAPDGHRWWRKLGFDWPHYWEYVLGETPPFPIIQDPKELVAVVQDQIARWTPKRSDEVRNWWSNHKQSLRMVLREEIRKLQG